METLLSIVHVFVCVFMILVILLQAGKSGGIGGMAGGAATVFGGRGSQTILSKITTVCAAIFMVTSLSLAYLSSRSDSVVAQRAAAAAEKAAPAKAAETKPAAAAAPVAPSPAPAAAPVAADPGSK